MSLLRLATCTRLTLLREVTERGRVSEAAEMLEGKDG